jgi:transcriptional regulator NrdR family protein
MTEVIKTSGKKEKFDIEKLRRSIKKAFIDAGLSVMENKQRIESVVKSVLEKTKEKAQVTSSGIRKVILESLDRTKITVSDAWRRFDRRYKKQ